MDKKLDIMDIDEYKKKRDELSEKLDNAKNKDDLKDILEEEAKNIIALMIRTGIKEMLKSSEAKIEIKKLINEESRRQYIKP